MDRLEFGLLGPTTVIGVRGEISVHGALRRRLLTRLLVSAGRPVAMDRLMEDLWEGEPPPSAASTLKSHVSLLRRSLGLGRLLARNGGYLIVVEPDELDLQLFELEVSEGRQKLRSGDADHAVAAFACALGRWRGPALAEVADTGWGRPEAVRLEEMRAATLDSWLEARLALGESQQVVAAAEAAVAEHPLREQLWAKLIMALYRSGRQGDALRAYQRLRDVLEEQLGISPSPQLAELEASVLRQDPVLSVQRHPQPARWADSSGNLPAEVTSFVPRPKELADVAVHLSRPGLLTLAGPGGTGKTRLAIECARRAAAGLDATWMCELAGVTDPADVGRELGLTLGCADSADVDLLDLVGRRLSEGSQLLVVDNCEHMLDACAEVVTRLRKEAPRLRILVTSRAPLEAAGEVVYRVPPMSTPDEPAPTEDLLAYESVKLFAERASAHQPHFELAGPEARSVAAICRRLDGIPLAIELAAARLRTMTVSDIEERLDDRFLLLNTGLRSAPNRQRTLSALIDWSYELLSAEERAVFSSLAVFASSFDTEAAEAVVGPTGISTLDVLAALVDKSLVQFDLAAGRSRYRMLETIRDYAGSRADPDDHLVAIIAHSRYFAGLASRAMPHFTGAGHLEWRSRLENDDENLRAAFVTALRHANADHMLRFAAALCRYWSSRGSYGDEMAMIASALERPDSAMASASRGDALAAAAFMCFRRGENVRAQELVNEALQIARDLGLHSLAADVLRTGAWVADRRGQLEAAAALATQAVAEAELSGSAHLIARCYDVRATTAHRGDPQEARADYAESLRYCREAGDVVGQASTLNNLAILELERENHHAARAYFDQALSIATAMGDPALLPFIRYGFGLASLLERDFATALLSLVDSIGDARRTGQRSLEAYAILATAVARIHVAPDMDAGRLLGAAMAMFDSLGEQPEPTEAKLLAEGLGLISTALGDLAGPALDAGRGISPSEAANIAMQPCPGLAAVIE